VLITAPAVVLNAGAVGFEGGRVLLLLLSVHGTVALVVTAAGCLPSHLPGWARCTGHGFVLQGLPLHAVLV
jgi:hypothetical protein